MATPTYIFLHSLTLSSDSSSVTFSNIDTLASGYKDLVFVVTNATAGSSSSPKGFRFNNDTGANYDSVSMGASGSSVITGSRPSSTQGYLDNNLNIGQGGHFRFQIFDFSATDKYKSSLIRTSKQIQTGYGTSMWKNTSAITNIEFRDTSTLDVFPSGTTFFLYGIEA